MGLMKKMMIEDEEFEETQLERRETCGYCSSGPPDPNNLEKDALTRHTTSGDITYDKCIVCGGYFDASDQGETSQGVMSEDTRMTRRRQRHVIQEPGGSCCTQGERNAECRVCGPEQLMICKLCFKTDEDLDGPCEEPEPSPAPPPTLQVDPEMQQSWDNAFGLPTARTVVIPRALAEALLDNTCDLKGERAWWENEPRMNYQRDYAAYSDEIKQLQEILDKA